VSGEIFSYSTFMLHYHYKGNKFIINVNQVQVFDNDGIVYY